MSHQGSNTPKVVAVHLLVAHGRHGFVADTDGVVAAVKARD
jgi:hypothetical protein